MKNPTRGELLDIIQVTWKLKEGSRLFLKDVFCFGVPWTAWCQGFYSCDSFGFMRSGRCWKSCNKRTRFGAGCFPRLPWSFSTFGRIFSQAPKKSSGNSHPRPKPAQVPLPGNSVFFFGLGGKQPGWPWKITRMFFFPKGQFSDIFFLGGGVGKQNRSKGFFGENDGISIFVVGRDFGSCRFCFKSLGRDDAVFKKNAHGMLLEVLPRSFLITWSINIQKTTERWRAVFFNPRKFSEGSTDCLWKGSWEEECPLIS